MVLKLPVVPGRGRGKGVPGGWSHHCPLQNVRQNFSALQALWNCISYHRTWMFFGKQFHQVGARAENASALVEDSSISFKQGTPWPLLTNQIHIFHK